MNERIKDLAVEVIVKNISADAWVFTDLELEKFAELIVKECIAVHLDNYGVDIIGDVLKKHFGVLE
jgi:hypothetical protein